MLSKWCCVAVVLAVVCLPVILLSLDAQPTIDESMTCSASMLDEVMNIVKIMASNQQDNAQVTKDEIRGVKTLLMPGSGETNETRLDEVAKEIKEHIKDVNRNGSHRDRSS